MREGLTEFYNKLCKFYSTDEIVKELMSKRGYTTENMYNTLKEVGVTKVDYLSDIRLFVDITDEELKQFGLLTKNGDYLLGGKYVVPIRDFDNLITALVGWDENGGSRKYITSPTIGFSKDVQFFNAEMYEESVTIGDGTIFIVEGIFDTLSLRSEGLYALGNMGLDLSPSKAESLNRWSKKIACHDNDIAGKAVNPYLKEVSEKRQSNKWDIDGDVVFIKLPRGVKDIDALIRDYDCREDLERSKSTLYTYKISIEE